MFSIGDWMYNLFGNDAWGVLLCVFLIFLIDALVFPTLPELFFVIGFIYEPTLEFGLALLIVAVIAEIIGITVLYWVVEHIKVPDKIKNIVDRYVNFLVCSDERILLVNRAAPMIPFAGAFVSIIDSWRLSKALFYVVLGCLIKYGLILLMSDFFFKYFNSDAAQTYTIIFIFVVIAVSFVAAFWKKKRKGIANENC